MHIGGRPSCSEAREHPGFGLTYDDTMIEASGRRAGRRIARASVSVEKRHRDPGGEAVGRAVGCASG